MQLPKRNFHPSTSAKVYADIKYFEVKLYVKCDFRVRYFLYTR